jgi:hypothetical protein
MRIASEASDRAPRGDQRGLEDEATPAKDKAGPCGSGERFIPDQGEGNLLAVEPATQRQIAGEGGHQTAQSGSRRPWAHTENAGESVLDVGHPREREALIPREMDHLF